MLRAGGDQLKGVRFGEGFRPRHHEMMADAPLRICLAKCRVLCAQSSQRFGILGAQQGEDRRCK